MTTATTLPVTRFARAGRIVNAATTCATCRKPLPASVQYRRYCDDCWMDMRALKRRPTVWPSAVARRCAHTEFDTALRNAWTQADRLTKVVDAWSKVGGLTAKPGYDLACVFATALTRLKPATSSDEQLRRLQVAADTASEVRAVLDESRYSTAPFVRVAKRRRAVLLTAAAAAAEAHRARLAVDRAIEASRAPTEQSDLICAQNSA